MKRRKVLFIVLLISLLASALLSGCAPTDSATEEEEGPIIIGSIVPMTGPQQFEGQLELASAKMAVDEINEAGGVLGRPVTLVFEDTQNQPAVAVSGLEKLITNNKIVALQGAQWSSETKAIMPTLAEYGIPAITAVSTAPDITEGDLPGKDWVFRVVPHDGLSAGAMATFLSGELGSQTIAFLVKNDDWGRQASDVIAAKFVEGGGEVLATEFFDGGETNFLAQATKIKELNPDAVVLAAQAQDGSMIVKQFNEVGLEADLIGLGAFASGTFVELAGEASEGVYGLVQYTDEIDTPENQEFVERWAERHPQFSTPDKYAWGPYTATMAIFYAIEHANSTDPEAIRDALEEISFEGLTGEIKFDENHQAHPNVYITQIQDGIPVTIAAVETN